MVDPATMSYMAENLSIRIPPALRREVERLARRQKRPVSEVAREALRRYVAVERFRALRNRTLPLAEAQGLLTDEDVFRAIS
jgi:predicted transcriptional regulator